MTDDEQRSVLARIEARTCIDTDGSDCLWYDGAHNGLQPITSINRKSVQVRRVLLTAEHSLRLNDLSWQATSTCGNPACINLAHLTVKPSPGRTTAAPTKLTALTNMTTMERDCWIADSRKKALRNDDDDRLTEDTVRAIRRAEGSLTEIGAQFGIHKSTVSMIRARRTWSWVPDDPTDALTEPFFVDIGVPMSRLDRQSAALVLQVDAHAFYCGDCMVTDLAFDPRDDRPRTSLHSRNETVARVLCALVHDLPLWASHAWHVRHICGNAACVNPNHLAPGTPEQNEADKLRHGTRARGERMGTSTLTETQAQWLIDTAGEVPATIAAQRVGCTAGHVRAVRRGSAWQHVLGNDAQ